MLNNLSRTRHFTVHVLKQLYAKGLRTSLMHVLIPILQAPIHHVLRSLGLPLTILFMNYVVTWRCNLRCIMCNIWKHPQTNELGISELEDFLRNPLLSQLEWIQLTGGEPFMRNDLDEIIRVILTSHPRLDIYKH